MHRRSFLTLLGGAAAAWPLGARAQQRAVPVIGFLDPRSPDTNEDSLRAFRQALRQAGYIDGENVIIIYRWAENRFDRLPALAADLVRRRVAVIVTTGGPAAHLAAKKATATIPIVFNANRDPVSLGLVASIARPGGNLTGVNFFSGELGAKRLELLHELVPAATQVGLLVNPADPENVATTLKDVKPAAGAMELQIRTLEASTSSEIDQVFANFKRERPDALFVASGSFFASRRVQIAQLAARYAIPTSYSLREFAEVGGLMSYGTSLADAYVQLSTYVARILKGTKPADLPVVQSSKFELVINHQTARMLGLTVPPLLLTIADEVIE